MYNVYFYFNNFHEHIESEMYHTFSHCHCHEVVLFISFTRSSKTDDKKCILKNASWRTNNHSHRFDSEYSQHSARINVNANLLVNTLSIIICKM
jgi:hypothetical protein